MVVSNRNRATATTTYVAYVLSKTSMNNAFFQSTPKFIWELYVHPGYLKC